ncbi:MAG: carbohydrate ABC transporter permease, partial [Oscillospiraceae bacterium]|nr:carbohydrate ABC transporter permease [Oscillospiraceae bacterium]
HNTLLLSVPILLMTILLCTMSGYGLSKFRFPGRKALLISYIIILLLPVQVTLVPFFIFFNTMHLMESRFPLIAFCSFSPFGAFLMYQFIRSIPDDSIEAARLEGASEWRIFWRIVFPQATPGIAALTILTLIDCFSMIEQPFMLLREKSWYPMSIMLKYLSQQNISEAFVLAVVFVIPVFLAYLLLQDYLIEGISHTAPGRIK